MPNNNYNSQIIRASVHFAQNSWSISVDGNSTGIDSSSVFFDATICHYLNLDYFIDMMECNRFYVNRRKVFLDHTEHYIPFSWAGFYMPAGEEPKPEKIENWNDVRSECSRVANMPTLCWTLTPRESYLMWKGYTEGIGVCVVSSIKKFVYSICDDTSFKRDHCVIRCGQMIYNGFSTIDIKNLPFWKGREYESENELRFYFEIENDTYNDNHIFIPIDRSILVDKVIISPFVTHRTASTLTEMLHNRYGFNVSPSKIQIQ